MTMKDMEEYAQFNRDFRDAAVSGFNHGLSVSEVADAWKVPEKYRGYHGRTRARESQCPGYLFRAEPRLALSRKQPEEDFVRLSVMP